MQIEEVIKVFFFPSIFSFFQFLNFCCGKSLSFEKFVDIKVVGVVLRKFIIKVSDIQIMTIYEVMIFFLAKTLFLSPFESLFNFVKNLLYINFSPFYKKKTDLIPI